jgi:hypothetical protein
MVKKGIDQGAGKISISRMNDHSGRLIDDDDGRIFVKDGERQGLRF